MPLPRVSTIREIKNRIVSDLETAFNQDTPSLLIAFNRILATALAGFIRLLYEAIVWTYAQIFPEKSEIDTLRKHGDPVDVTERLAITAVIQADIFGIDGRVVQIGTLFRNANGIVFSVTTSATIAGGSARCELTSQIAGSAGNTIDGETLSIVASDENLTGIATVVTTITTGDDAESLESFRSRVIAGYQKRKTGGSPADYEEWGLEAPGFIWVSAYSSETDPGTVIVYGQVDTRPDGIPTTSDLTQLLEYLTRDPVSGKRRRAPTTDVIDVQPIRRKLFDIDITLRDGTLALRESIESAIKTYLESRQPYNEGTSLERLDVITTSGIAAVVNEIAEEAGASILNLQLSETDIGAVVTVGYVLLGGEFAKLGTITWVALV